MVRNFNLGNAIKLVGLLLAVIVDHDVKIGDIVVAAGIQSPHLILGTGTSLALH